MSERARWGAAPWIVALALVIAGGCGLRTLTILFHTPATCPTPEAEEERACPLVRVRSVETRLLRQDGTPLDGGEACEEVTESICTIEDLESFVFLMRTEASDGIEVIIEARSERGCGGELVLACDSFGDAVIDLTTADEIPTWCECPRSLTP